MSANDRAAKSDIKERSWYLPHFPVIRADKETAKTRIVYDASAKHDGISLNDVIYQGPKLQQDLFEVLLRFRRCPVAVICDIAEMYLQIQISEEDRPFHRFLWRDLDQTREPDVYEFNRVVFGINSSPFIAQFVAQENAKKYQGILKSTYMDDSIDSAPDNETAIQLCHQLSKVWSKAGMHARKWLSNSENVLKEIPINDRAQEVDLDKSELPSVKTLGIFWLSKEDVFTYKYHAPDDTFNFTKRNFLRKIASLFDPIGFIAPYTIRAKILLQQLWTSGIGWDDQLQENHAKEAAGWFQELEQLTDVKVPRCIQTTNKKLSSLPLHTFTDASEKAYGAVVYTRCQYENRDVSTNIIAAKSKVAPLMTVSIPRLELLGAMLGLKLSKSVADVLDIEVKEITFWSDSMDVIWWIHNQSRRFKPFVANRVGLMHSATIPNQWRYVPTKENPADDLTRGLKVSEIAVCLTWWNGPEFLKEDQDMWPQTKMKYTKRVDTEMKPEKSTKLCIKDESNNKERAMLTINEDQPWRLKPSRFSCWTRLTRESGWIYRFINNCFSPREKKTKGELSPEELQDVEIMLIKSAQKETFSDEMKLLQCRKKLPKSSKLLGLKPKLDEEGVMRCDGRLQYADHLSLDTKYPIILPRRSWVTKLIVKRYHEDT